MDALSELLAILKPESYVTAGLDAGGDWAMAQVRNERKTAAARKQIVFDMRNSKDAAEIGTFAPASAWASMIDT